jgi:hypothetical protein
LRGIRRCDDLGVGIADLTVKTANSADQRLDLSLCVSDLALGLRQGCGVAIADNEHLLDACLLRADIFARRLQLLFELSLASTHFENFSRQRLFARRTYGRQ